MDAGYRVRFIADGDIRHAAYLGCEIEMVRSWTYRELYRLTDEEPDVLWTATITEGTSHDMSEPEFDRAFYPKDGGLNEGHLIAFAALLDNEMSVDTLFACSY